MKNISSCFSLFAAIGLMLACNNSNAPKDSVDSANQKNQSLDSGKYGGRNMDSTATDEAFLVKAFSGGMTEVMLGKAALKNAALAQVKQFGQMMITDHTKADSEMAVIAKLKNIALPDKPSNDMYDHINKLQAKHGKDFDNDYVSYMIDDHKDDIDDFKKAAQDVKDPDIKAFAEKTIPVLEKHLTSVQAIDSIMKKK